MPLDSIQAMKDSDRASEAEFAAASLGAVATRGGVFHSPARLPMANQAQSGSESGAAGQRRISARRVGLRYVVQVLTNSLPLLIVDIVALTATIAACRLLFHYLNLRVGIDVSSCLAPIATGFVLLNIELGLYPGVRLSPIEELRRLVVSVTCMFIVWAVGVSVLTGGLTTQISYLLAVYLGCLLALPVGRSWMRRILGRWTRWGVPVFICGNDAAAVKTCDWLNSNRRLGLRPVGVIGDAASLGADDSEGWYAGPWSQTHDLAVRNGVYWVIIVPSSEEPLDLSALIVNYLYTVPHIHVLSELTGLPDQWSAYQQLEGLGGIHLQQNLMLPLPRLTKRVMDLVGGVLCVLGLLPLLFYIAVAVKLSSRGPIMYGHERIGKNGRRFRAWKFRSMFENSNDVLEYYLEQHPELREEWEKDHKLRYDPRVTRIGRFIRKTSLDELPQLWNVIRGEMSLVGPRPIVTAEISKYGAFYGLYTMVTPGITGLWQVSGRNNTTYDERVQLDAYYVRHWSPWMDMYLLLRTIRIVLFAHGAY